MPSLRAEMTAERSRAFISGSGRPARAATVISRLSLENSEERFLSCAPLRYMMFLYLEWPAFGASAPQRFPGTRFLRTAAAAGAIPPPVGPRRAAQLRPSAAR